MSAAGRPVAVWRDADGRPAGCGWSRHQRPFRSGAIRLSYLNEKLCLDAAQARRNSPLLNLPVRAAKFMIALGLDRLPEPKRQSREFGAAWSAHGLPGEMIEAADCHHYAILEQLAQPDGLLAKALAVSAKGDPA
jgi:hypothetical protein